MNKRKKYLNHLKKSQSGAAMILVLCVMILFFALALTILLSASSISGNATQEVLNKRCQIAAVSLSQVLGKELTNEQKETNSSIVTLNDYIRYHMDPFMDGSAVGINAVQPGDKWIYYCPDATGSSIEAAEHNFSIAEDEGLADNEDYKSFVENGYSITVTMYWEMDGATLDNYENADYNIIKCDDSNLIVIVRCKKGDVSYQTKAEYELNLLYEGRRFVEDEIRESPEKMKALTYKQVEWRWNQLRRD